MNACEFFARCGVYRLPVDPVPAARQLGLSLVTYEQFCRVSGVDMLSLLRSHNPDAFTFVSSDGPVVVYNRQRTPGRRRWNIVHELSHFVLGELDCGTHGEQDADRLTADILCPLPVVSLCGVRNVRELQQLCGLSHEAAALRWRSLCAFRRGEQGPFSETDWQLVRRFQPFISAVLDGFSPQSTTFPVE